MISLLKVLELAFKHLRARENEKSTTAAVSKEVLEVKY